MADPGPPRRGFAYRYPGRARPALRDPAAHHRARRVRGHRRALRLGEVDAPARGLRARPALPRRGGRGRARGGGAGRELHGPAELASVVGLVAQEPETQVVSTTVRAEIELPLELRGARPPARARAVEEVALALAIPDLLARRPPTPSPAVSCSGWPSPPPSPPGRASSCSTSRPRSSTRSRAMS